MIKNIFPSISTSTCYTKNGTPYLQQSGVSVIATTNTNIDNAREFLDGFSKDLEFQNYLNDASITESPAGLTKFAGQLCYMSFGPKRTTNSNTQKYINHIIESGHGSVLEHASISFLLWGVSRSCIFELVRHRVGTAFSQVSQRYVGGKTLRFVERPEYQNDTLLHSNFETRIDVIALQYHELTEKLISLQQDGSLDLSAEAKTDLRKKVQQVARSILPNETEAPLVFTVNIRALRHIIEMRNSPHAETEISRLFHKIFLCAKQVSPYIFNDYSIKQINNDNYVITDYRKV